MSLVKRIEKLDIKAASAWDRSDDFADKADAMRTAVDDANLPQWAAQEVYEVIQRLQGKSEKWGNKAQKHETKLHELSSEYRRGADLHPVDVVDAIDETGFAPSDPNHPHNLQRQFNEARDGLEKAVRKAQKAERKAYAKRTAEVAREWRVEIRIIEQVEDNLDIESKTTSSGHIVHNAEFDLDHEGKLLMATLEPIAVHAIKKHLACISSYRELGVLEDGTRPDKTSGSAQPS